MISGDVPQWHSMMPWVQSPETPLPSLLSNWIAVNALKYYVGGKGSLWYLAKETIQERGCEKELGRSIIYHPHIAMRTQFLFSPQYPLSSKLSMCLWNNSAFPALGSLIDLRDISFPCQWLTQEWTCQSAVAHETGTRWERSPCS